MRTIEQTTAFRRDFKREKRGQYRRDLDSALSGVLSLLVEDSPLPEKSGTTANAISSPTCC